MNPSTKDEILRITAAWYRVRHTIGADLPILADAPNNAETNGDWHVHIQSHEGYPGATVVVPREAEPHELDQ